MGLTSVFSWPMAQPFVPAPVCVLLAGTVAVRWLAAMVTASAVATCTLLSWLHTRVPADRVSGVMAGDASVRRNVQREGVASRRDTPTSSAR
ncbi:hypothetical protein D3C78_1161630 [compost metagenome]